MSVRKVDRLVEQLGIEGMTKDRGSVLCRVLDEQVEPFRQQPLEGVYPYYGLTPSRSWSAITAGSSPKQSWLPMRCMRPAYAR